MLDKFFAMRRRVVVGLVITILMALTITACNSLESQILGQWIQSQGSDMAKFSTTMKFETEGKGTVNYKGSVSFLGVGGEVGTDAVFKWQIKDGKLFLNFDKPEASKLHNVPIKVTFTENKMTLKPDNGKEEIFTKVENNK